MPSVEALKDGAKGIKMVMPSLSKASAKFNPMIERLFQANKEAEFPEDLAKKADRARSWSAIKGTTKQTGKRAWQGAKHYETWAMDRKHNIFAGVVAPLGIGALGVHEVHKGIDGMKNFADPTAHADSNQPGSSHQDQQNSGSSNLLKNGLLAGGGLLAGSMLLGRGGGMSFLMKAGVLLLALKLLGGQSSQKLVGGLDNGLKSFEKGTEPLLPESASQQMAQQGQKIDLQQDLKSAQHAPSDGASQNYAAQTQQQIGKAASQNMPQSQAQQGKNLQTNGPEAEV